MILSASVLFTLVITANTFQNEATGDSELTGIMAKSMEPTSIPEALPRDSTCPMWTRTTSNDTCECGSNLRLLIQCSPDNHTVNVPKCYCISRMANNVDIFGFCQMRCHIPNESPAYIGSGTTHYRLLANNTHYNDSELTNRALCSDLNMNRTGVLCGSCVKGFAPPVYSYSFSCVQCSSYKLNWLKYIAAAYLPLTVFYFCMILFRMPATSGIVNGYITICQILTSPNIVRLGVTTIGVSKNTSSMGLKIIVTFYSIWNLDFFRSLYHPFCIHPNLTTLETRALDYAVAVYPLLLIVLTYILVTLHDHHIFFVRLWRPFYKCFRFFREEWNLRTSLVSAFATFILLSYVKILNTSLDLLAPLTVYNMDGVLVKQKLLNIDGTVEYFGKQHLPFALLAIFMCFVFNILPFLLLCLYPCRCFHKCLNHFNLHSQRVHTFVEVFQGCFKTHPRDCRHFAAFYIFLRIINVVTSSYLLDEVLYTLVLVMVLTIATITIAVIKPYKLNRANKMDIILFTLTIFVLNFVPMYRSMTMRVTAAKLDPHILLDLTKIGINILLFCHFLFGIGIFTAFILPRRFKERCLDIFKRAIKFIRYRHAQSDSELDRLVPDRLVNPDDPEYAPLPLDVSQTEDP